MNRLRLVLMGLFLAGVAVLVVSYNIHKPKVLILNSYDPSYPWTRDVSVGVRRVLERYPHITTQWFYMDAKRHPWPENKEKMGLAARQMIDRWQPDVVIAIDDDAQEYVTRHYLDHPRLRIVFAGVNGEIEPYGFDKAANVTGILERKDLRALKEALLALEMPRSGGGALRVRHIGDQSQSVKQDDRYMAQFDWQPLLWQAPVLVNDFEAWQAAVTEASGKADVIVSSNYRKLTRSRRDQSLVPAKEVVRWTLAHSRLPVIGTNGFFVEDGGALAIGTSPYEQGEVAARMALALLAGKRAREIPVASTGQFVVYMRSNELRRQQLSLPPLYEAFAKATDNDLP